MPSPRKTLPDTDGPTVLGRMTFELHDNGTSRPTPVIKFDPPGRFSSGMLMEYQQLMSTELLKAHAAQRHYERHGKPMGAPR